MQDLLDVCFLFRLFFEVKTEATCSSESSVGSQWTISLHVPGNNTEHSGSIRTSAVRILRLCNFNIYFHEFRLLLNENSTIVTSINFPCKLWLMDNFRNFCCM